MPIIDQSGCPVKTGSIYPEPYASEMAGRSSLRLGDAGGLTQFGANLVILQPGAKSSLRHWHLHEDEFVMVTLGICSLVQDAGETEMHPGDCAAFPAGDPDGHHFINRTANEARFLVVGTRAKHEVATYCDVDLRVELAGGKAVFTHKDGSPCSGNASDSAKEDKK
ncbi:MAG: cupin domain-containing protein [Pseudorhodobacter sp.]|nr:cupin domain-containing protein [Pseudorhodobacter sp.]